MSRGTLHPWLLRTTLRRLRDAWRLLLVVLVVAVLASTAVTSVGLLLGATEQSGLRSALTALPAAQTTLELTLSNPTVSLGDARAAGSRAVGRVLGDAATSTSSAAAFTGTGTVSGVALPAVAYFGELDGIESHATLTAGVWAAQAPQTAGGGIPVAVPSAAAGALHLGIGSRFTVQMPGKDAVVQVVGLYRPIRASAPFWNRDLLRGAGNNAAYLSPDSEDAAPTETFGPLIAPGGALDALGIRVQSLDIRYVPDYDRATPGELAPLIDRLDDADATVPTSVGGIAGQVVYSTSGDATYPLKQIASNLIVTRSTVLVVTLLLLVLAVAALGQSARLFTDARAGERQLMRARGASGRQVLALATLEACIVGLAVTVTSPLLARLVYRVLAGQPAMVAAHMPTDAGMPWLSWATAAAVSVLFVGVLVAPLLTRGTTFAQEQQRKVRGRRASGLMRSGIDIGVVVVAAVVYWQLQSYRSPVTGTSSLAVDPVLASAPAIVLLATSLVCVRLIPLVARAADGLARRSRGAVLSLAAWEVGRRSQRAISAVLLLTLALAVGTFGQSFLATWQQSQVDQAALAVGAPVRISVDPARASEQAALLRPGARSSAQPVIHRTATVAGSQATLSNPNSLDGTDAVVLGLTSEDRAMTDRGRLAEEGGHSAATRLKSTATLPVGTVLPGDVQGMSATVRVGNPGGAMPGVAARLHAIVEDANGLLTTVDFGSVDVDGRAHEVSGLLQLGSDGRGPAAPLRFVGFQSTMFMSDQAAYGSGQPARASDIVVNNLAVLHRAASGSDYSTVPVRTSASTPWFGIDTDAAAPQPQVKRTASGSRIDLQLTVPAGLDVQPATFVVTGWQPVATLPAVLSSGLADSLSARAGTTFTLVLSGGLVSIRMVGTAALVPGSADASQLTPGTASGAVASQAATVVVDHALLERALAQAGIAGPMVDEWWVDVRPGNGQAYLDAHRATGGAPAAKSAEVLGLQMQQSPLRVATQAVLWLAIVAAAALAAIGFAVHTAATLRSRRVEFARLRAIGLSRRRLVSIVAAESLLICLLGVVFGTGVGVVLGWLVGPLVAVSPDGSPPVPAVIVAFPWANIAVLTLVVLATLACVVALVAQVQRTARPADVLRESSDA